MTKLPLILVFIVILLASISAEAEDNLDFFRDSLDVIANKVSPSILNKLNSEESIRLSKIKFKLVENLKVVTFAGTNNVDDTIYISTGFMNGLYNSAECFLLESEFSPKNLCDSYFKYYFDIAISSSLVPPDSVASIFFHSDEKKLKNWENNLDMRKAAKIMYMAALISVTMHEYGHHIIGFPQKNASISDYRKLEGDVEKWSFATLNRIDNPPLLGAVISLSYLSQMELYRKKLRVKNKNNPDFKQIPTMHPMPRARAELAYNYSCGDSMKDKTWLKTCNFFSSIMSKFE